MVMQLFFMFIKLFLAVTALLVHGSAGFDIPSLRAASVLLRFKIGTHDLTSYRTTRATQTFLQNAPPPTFGQKRHRSLVAASPKRGFHHLLPVHHSPAEAPSQSTMRHSSNAFVPKTPSSKRTANKWIQGYASSPSFSHYKHHHTINKLINVASAPSNQLQSPTHSPQGVRPSLSPLHSPFPSITRSSSPAPAPAPLPTTISSQFRMPVPPPMVSSSSSSQRENKTPPPSTILVLPPPPPNGDCTSVTCTEPLTYSPPGSPCGCVWPIEVSLSVSVALYTFFPLVSELAKEIATDISLNRSQVRIMGANAGNQQLEKTIVLINLVPLRENFDHSTAFLIYKKFWHKLVSIKTSLFGAYEVVYVRYPGLPPSPPSVPSSASIVGDKSYPGHGNNGRAVKPIPVYVPRKQKDRLGGSMIAVIVISSVTAFVVCIGAIWLLMLRCGSCIRQPYHSPHVLVSSQGKTSGDAVSLRFGSRRRSGSMSFSSSLLSYTGTAKIFSLNDIEKATDNFDTSRILGEGGFGLVYSGLLDDGRKAAVKVLKRDDRQGSREFLAEVEMLSRLHHRNLVKLIGICSEDHIRCLVYELVPNGSVESHLHGVDKEVTPLDWGARMKIALGAARGLAYLHEDSSPRVIHRDFKSSNILLEEDFTPKVSDFGLARTALDEGNKHISTHVMGTFGYLAPEYAMTGHLLVKSDVYSYGVVLLELLTGRKPVDLSQPPGQENLVAWVRPLLTSKEGLETIIDAGIKSDRTFDSVAKVAAIASMCVQPEVSHRPFMGEVVQALKLVCNEFDETIEPALTSTSQEDLFTTIVDTASKLTGASGGDLAKASFTHYSMCGYDSTFDSKMVSAASDLVSVSARFNGQEPDSFRRQSNSAPLGMGKKRKFWQRLRGSASEHGYSCPGSH